MATEQLNIIMRVQQGASSAALKSVQTGIRGVGLAASAARGFLNGFVGQMTALAATVGTAAFLKSSIDTFKEFDDTIRAAGAVAGATGEELQKLTRTAEEMGRKTRFSATEAAEGLQLLGMAGFTVQESTAALPGVLNLAAAGALDLGDAADIATNVLSGFGLEVESLGSVNDVLAKTFTSSNTTLTELGEGFKLVGPIAAGVGADFEDLVGSLGKLGDAGLKGTIAGTSLRGALSALLNPTKQEAQLMEELGQRIGQSTINVRDANGQFVGFVEITRQLEEAGLDGAEALKLFGDRAGPGMQALLQVGSRELGNYIDSLKIAGGTTDRIAEQMEAGIGGASRRAAAAFEGVRIALARAFEQEIIDGFDYLSAKFNELIQAIERLDREGKLDAWATLAVQSLQVVAQGALKVAQTFNYVGKSIATTLLGMRALWTRNEQDIDAFRNGVADTDAALRKLLGLPLEKEPDVTRTFYKIGENGEIVAKEIVNVTKREAEALKSEVAALDRALESARQKTKEKAGPIGRGGRTGSEAQQNRQQLEQDAAAAATILRSSIQTEMALLENEYGKGLINLDKYFTEREALVQRRIAREIELLRKKESTEEDPVKQEQLAAQIYAKEEELATAIIQLDAERYEAQKRLDESRLREQEALKQKELKAEKAYQDQLDRIKQGPSFGLEAQFNKELSDLQTKQNQELELVREFYNDKLQTQRDAGATEVEIAQTVAEQKNAIRQQQEAQDKERERVQADQQQRLVKFQLDTFAQTYGGVASTLENIYELTGKKNKELFIASKAFAIAQAIMKTYESATSAYASMAGIPYVGPALGAAAAAAAVAAGLANVASIKGQSLAQGGEVLGRSPTTTADNIPINATAGEFMQPVDAVRYYGKNVMEALRTKAIPKELLTGFSAPHVRYGHAHFQSGGAVTPKQIERSGENLQDQIQINNFMDPAAFSQHMQTTAGQRDVWNVLTNNPYKLKQLVFAQ